MSDDHERIWLEPQHATYGLEGRLWCQDDVFTGADGYENDPPPTEYVRADLAAAELAAARAEIERLRAGIQDMIDGDYPNPRDHRPLKCRHDTWYYEECKYCNDEWLQKLLSDQKSLPEAP